MPRSSMPAAEKGTVRFVNRLLLHTSNLEFLESVPQTQSKDALPNLSSEGRSTNSCDHSP